jgi:phage regulator Rha-like protein
MVSDIDVFAYEYAATTMASNIAKVFGVSLETVLWDIKTAIKEIDPVLDHNNECIEEWFDLYGSSSTPMENDCYLSKNGAMYIFMKYTGEHAAEAKVKYVKAFDAVNEDLSQKFTEDAISDAIREHDLATNN